jgi:hypothetical protein
VTDAKVWLFVSPGGGVTWPRPGRKKLAGVIVCEALIPPQPTAPTSSNPNIAARSIFQVNFTLAVWGSMNMGATLKSSWIPMIAGAVVLLAGTVGVQAFADESSFVGERTASTDFLAKAKAAFEAAQSAQSTNADNLKANIDLARTAFDYADISRTDHEREPIALKGIAAGRAAIGIDANSAPAHYYLALNLGQDARTKMLGALKLLTEMEHELKRAAELDPKFDYGGPNRTLGDLYLEAPGWPTSIGSKSKARQNLERAVELAPEYPDNHLSLIEALQKWHDKDSLPDRVAAYEKLLPSAKEKFTGAQWEDEWVSWDKRWKAIQAKQHK